MKEQRFGSLQADIDVQDKTEEKIFMLDVKVSADNANSFKKTRSISPRHTKSA